VRSLGKWGTGRPAATTASTVDELYLVLDFWMKMPLPCCSGRIQAHVASDSGLYSGVTDQATSPTVVARAGEHLILFLSASNFIKR
jgi:hypothetical protein